MRQQISNSQHVSPWPRSSVAGRGCGAPWQSDRRWDSPHRGAIYWGRPSPQPTPGQHASSPQGGETSLPEQAAGVTDGEDETPAQRRKRTEAVLFLHRGPIPLRKLASLAALADATEARTRVRELNQLYDDNRSSLRIEEVGGGHQLFTRPSVAPWVRRLKSVPDPVRLGSVAMETLAIIAYRQPVPRADIEAIRGVACGELVRHLIERNLVRICGRSEDLGRPYLYGTTPQFLQLFGLKSLAALPELTGASIRENSDDTLANPEDLLQGTQGPTPIDPPSVLNFHCNDSSPPALVTAKESDVSIVRGPVVFDEVADLLDTDTAVAVLPADAGLPPQVVASDEDEDEDWDDDEEADDDEDDWDDEDDEDLEDDEEEDEWEEVGDEEEGEIVEDEEDADELEADEELEDEEESDEEDEEWDDDDEDWDEDDEEGEEEEEEDEWD
jgi:segregation and condensation protein B